MKRHTSIASSMSWGIPLCLALGFAGCDPPADWAGTGVEGGGGSGKLALSWTLDGAFFTLDRCAAQKIDYMEVRIDPINGTGSVGYTQVRCDLDRYSLSMTPEGRVHVQVDGIGQDRTGQACRRMTGQAFTSAGISFPDPPAKVPLHLLSECQ